MNELRGFTHLTRCLMRMLPRAIPKKIELLMNYLWNVSPKYSARHWSGFRRAPHIPALAKRVDDWGLFSFERHPLGPKIDCFYLTLLTVLLSPLFNSHSLWFFSYLPLTARIDRLALVDGLSFTLTWTYAHQWCGYVRPCQGVIPACVYNLIVK